MLKFRPLKFLNLATSSTKYNVLAALCGRLHCRSIMECSFPPHTGGIVGSKRFWYGA